MLTPQLTPPSSLSTHTPPGHPDFVNVDPCYLCILCNYVLRDAVQTPCGHRLCQQCAEDYLGEESPRPCPYREEHCGNLELSKVQRDSSARREIRQFLVYCSNKSRGCLTMIKWKNLEKHLAECSYEAVPCPNRDDGCEEAVSRGNLSEHQLTCVYAPTQCEFCGKIFPKRLKERHDNEECQKIPIRCSFGCGIDPIPKHEMSAHQEICPRRLVVCKFASMGCTFEGLAEEVELHEKQNTKEHIHQTTQQLANINLYEIDLQKEIQELNDQSQHIRQKVKDIQKELKDIQHMVNEVKHEGRKRKLDVVDLTERIIRVEKQAEDLRPDVHRKIGIDVNILRENIRMEREKLDKLMAAEVLGEGATANPTTPSDPYEDLQKQTRQLGLQEAKLGELDLRFQILETINYDGVLLWKISNYHRRKQEAISGTTLSIYSSPFFTSRYGYKMCCRVYLNGDGMGKNTHFSIFFVVMQGEYDALLPWPFKQKVTFMILDQSGNGRHLSDSFRPDPNSSSFKRPLADMNIASGCPLFVSHSILDTSNSYVKEDSLFVKVMVDTSGLEPI